MTVSNSDSDLRCSAGVDSTTDEGRVVIHSGAAVVVVDAVVDEGRKGAVGDRGEEHSLGGSDP